MGKQQASNSTPFTPTFKSTELLPMWFTLGSDPPRQEPRDWLMRRCCLGTQNTRAHTTTEKHKPNAKIEGIQLTLAKMQQNQSPIYKIHLDIQNQRQTARSIRVQEQGLISKCMGTEISCKPLTKSSSNHAKILKLMLILCKKKLKKRKYSYSMQLFIDFHSKLFPKEIKL